MFEDNPFYTVEFIDKDEEILSIPRPSGKEEKIANYIVDFAKSHNLE